MKKYNPKEKYPVYSDVRALVTGCGNFSDKTLYKYFVGKDQIKELSYKAFSDNIINLATAAYALNLKGKKIAVMSEARPEFLQAYLATLCTNAVIVPLDKELMPDQILGFLEVAECSALFISPECKKKLGAALNDAKLAVFFA